MFARLGDEVLFVVVAVVLAFGIYQTSGQVLETDVPIVAVTTDSMVPTLHPGDMIVVRGTDIEALEAGEAGVQDGDIVVFQTERMPIPIIHRVVRANATAIETRGDNTAGQHGFERYITGDQVLGKAVFTVPYVGYIKLVPTCTLLSTQYDDPRAIDVYCPEWLLNVLATL